MRGIAVYLGYPEYAGDAIYNTAALIRDGQVLGNHRKVALPNYAVFDEKRYFKPGDGATVVDLDGLRIGLIICEDVWLPEPCRAPAEAGAQAILVINGSPFHMPKQAQREQVLAARASENSLPLIYVNMVGGQDELVFDGGSLVVDAAGDVRFRAPPFEEGLYVVDLDRVGGRLVPRGAAPAPLPPLAERVYRALVLGMRDYVEKNGFRGVVLGLSGGVDSALTLAIAVDALGPKRVHAVMMPSRYTSQMSIEDAAEEARRLGVRFDTLSIEPHVRDGARDAGRRVRGTARRRDRGEHPGALPRHAADGDLEQDSARCCSRPATRARWPSATRRCTATWPAASHRSRTARKTLVYQLAAYRNRVEAVIPERVITRAPTAELRPNQKDSDSLPPYDVLDPILEAFIEKDYSVEQIAALGFERATVVRVLQMVKRNEYKRRQAPPGVRVSNRAFGRDWRYPITSGY